MNVTVISDKHFFNAFFDLNNITHAVNKEISSDFWVVIMSNLYSPNSSCMISE